MSIPAAPHWQDLLAICHSGFLLSAWQFCLILQNQHLAIRAIRDSTNSVDITVLGPTIR